MTTSNKDFTSQIGILKLNLNTSSESEDINANSRFNSRIFFDQKLLIEESLFDSFKNREKKKKGLEGLLGNDGRDNYDAVAYQIVKDIDKDIRWTRKLFKKSDFNINLVFGF
ncbi:hypothetical protein [uncultured Tenacibaculum sp.]|uniref:hypothetical protein n=1 Tax=uncultured Tenacibaculum sp. TaxID=174713 RepID=UPI0026066E90|nr:hypothetical protein [uncultured Tenacibaculum sp.]